MDIASIHPKLPLTQRENLHVNEITRCSFTDNIVTLTDVGPASSMPGRPRSLYISYLCLTYAFLSSLYLEGTTHQDQYRIRSLPLAYPYPLAVRPNIPHRCE
jgi:hypothetical protein